MYLSKVHLDMRNARQLQILSDCYEAHRVVSCACGSGRNGARVLFRPEVPVGPSAVLLVQSELEPDWNRPLRTLSVDLEADYKRFEMPEFTPGQKLRFRLRANTTKTIRGGRDNERDAAGNLKRIRVPLTSDEAQLEWLERKLSASGAALEHAVLQKEGEVTGGRRSDVTTITLYSVRFEGMLTVRDSNALAAAVTSGIGPAKAFGFGLLSLSSP